MLCVPVLPVAKGCG